MISSDEFFWEEKNQNDRFFTQNIGELFIRTLEKRRTVETHYPYFVWKLSRQIVQIFTETSTNKDETGLFAWTTAVVICDACKVDITAGNDSDWLILTLTLVTLCGGGRVQWRPLRQASPCQVLPSPTPRVEKAWYSGYTVNCRLQVQKADWVLSLKYVIKCHFTTYWVSSNRFLRN